MKIEAFERNDQDEVVAISGVRKVVLSWEYIIDNKPQVGDSFILVDGVPVPGDDDVSDVEQALDETPVEPEKTE